MTRFATIFPHSKLLQPFNINVFDTLTIALICTILGWYAQYHWKRRKLYQMAAQRKGPLTLPFIGNVLYFLGSASDVVNHLLRLTTEFESPVRLWMAHRLIFVIWKPHDLEIIMNSPHALKKHELYKFAATVIGDGLATSSGSKWKRHRRIINPTLNQKILDEFAEIFSEQSEIFVKQLKVKEGKGTFDIFDSISRCTLDMICETAMGITVNAQTTESNYFKWINRAMELIFKRMVGIFYHPDLIYNRTAMAKELYDLVEKMNEFAGAVVTGQRTAYQRKLKDDREHADALIEEEPGKRRPFLQRLIEVSEEGANFTDKELLDEVKTLMAAGSDTTASTDSFVFVMLGMFPDIQHKVYEEVIDVLGPDKSVEFTDLGKLQYLEMVIKETMRLFPVGQMVARDITQDIELESCTIPAGSSVAMFLVAAHRDPSIWVNPLKFDPDRFLPEEVAKRHPYSWVPFSGGPRNCVGLKYAMMVMKVLIATGIRKYRFFSDYKSIEDITLKSELLLKPGKGYRVSIEPRE